MGSNWKRTVGLHVKKLVSAERDGEPAGVRRSLKITLHAIVVDKAMQGSEARVVLQEVKAEAVIWTERMLTALGNGVKGGKWFSLWDKVHRPTTLEHAWELVRKNKGAGGVDGVIIERFEGMKHKCMEELHRGLIDGSYNPEAVRRVYIPKGDGKVLNLIQHIQVD